jgi:hypothetical protein
MSKVTAIAVALATLCLLSTRTTPAQLVPDQPSRGVVHRDVKPSALLYECDQAKNGRLRCKFTELHVWKPLREIATNDEQRRTCTVAAHNYAQTFWRDGTPDAPSWITRTGPYGVCGFTRESRFVGSRQANGTVFWSYIAQLKVANKSADDGPLRCAEVREFDEHYDWQWREQPADCATVHFEPACASSDEFPCLGDGPVVVH